jgi:4-hydroxybenzoate polyprenyltransferase
MYAMADREDDRKIGIKSTAILFNQYDRLIISLLQIVILLLLILLGVIMHLAVYYYISLLIAASLATYQQLLLKKQDPIYKLKAFRNNNWFGAVIFLGILLSYI